MALIVRAAGLCPDLAMGVDLTTFGSVAPDDVRGVSFGGVDGGLITYASPLSQTIWAS